METIINLLVLIALAYLAVGILFGLFFVFIGAKKLDPAAVGGTFGFKLMILPGVALFWPLLLKRYIKKEMPTEYSKHREASK